MRGFPASVNTPVTTPCVTFLLTKRSTSPPHQGVGHVETDDVGSELPTGQDRPGMSIGVHHKLFLIGQWDWIDGKVDPIRVAGSVVGG
jgi:hypothetical protein